jgi:hypothetical protein
VTDKPADMLKRYPLIFCSLCGGNKPLVLSEMKADEVNDHDALDLMCGSCSLVIATLHEKAD